MKTIITLLLATFCTAIAAQPYVLGTASSGQIKANVGEGLSKSAIVGSLGAGYRFSRYFAAEASYLKSGTIHGEDAERVQGTSIFTTTHFFDVKGFGLSALGMLPVSERISLLGKLGANRLTLTHTTQTAQFQRVFPFSLIDVQSSTTHEQVWVPSIGIGAGFSPVRQVELRAMLEQVSGRGSLDRLTMLSLSAAFSF